MTIKRRNEEKETIFEFDIEDGSLWSLPRQPIIVVFDEQQYNSHDSLENIGSSLYLSEVFTAFWDPDSKFGQRTLCQMVDTKYYKGSNMNWNASFEWRQFTSDMFFEIFHIMKFGSMSDRIYFSKEKYEEYERERHVEYNDRIKEEWEQRTKQ